MFQKIVYISAEEWMDEWKDGRMEDWAPILPIFHPSIPAKSTNF
jgi:hypothetical protein